MNIRRIQYFDVVNPATGEKVGYGEYRAGAGATHSGQLADGTDHCSTCKAIRMLATDSKLGAVTCHGGLYEVRPVKN